MASLQRLTVRNQGHIYLGGAIGGVTVNMLLSMRITISSATRSSEVYTLPFNDFYVASGQPGSIGSTAIQ